MTVKPKYFLWFVILLLTELYIALYVKDRFIRPYIGDVLVVMLIYTFLMSLFKMNTKQGIGIVLVFSFSVEISQAFHLIRLLKLENCQIAHWVLGSSFNWFDFIAYIIGLSIVFVVEKSISKNKST